MTIRQLLQTVIQLLLTVMQLLLTVRKLSVHLFPPQYVASLTELYREHNTELGVKLVIT